MISALPTSTTSAIAPYKAQSLVGWVYRSSLWVPHTFAACLNHLPVSVSVGSPFSSSLLNVATWVLTLAQPSDEYGAARLMVMCNAAISLTIAPCSSPCCEPVRKVTESPPMIEEDPENKLTFSSEEVAYATPAR